MFRSIAAFVAGPDGQATRGGTQTITGRVMSLSYYGQNKAKPSGGLDQRLSDARASIKWEGMPAGIVTSDGKAYQVVGGLAANNNAKVVEFLGKTVTVTGEVSDQHGMLTISADSAKIAST
jgi:hypothetical protein